MLKPIDIEDALRKDVGQLASDVVTSAPPLPDDLGKRLPIVHFTRLGGDRQSMVIDTHSVSVDVYANTWGKAQETADAIAGIIAELQDIDNLSVHYLTSDLSTLPYNNLDPRHADIPRVTFSAMVSTRAIEQ